MFFRKLQNAYHRLLPSKHPLLTVSYDSFGLPWWLSSKESPAMQEMRVQSLDREDPLEKEMATHSSILA